ncbi:MAG: FecR family protein [Candidatus Acidiferrales bacterium]
MRARPLPGVAAFSCRKFVLLTFLVLIFAASVPAQQTTERAGKIGLVLPTGTLTHGTAAPVEAQRNADVFWQDIARTAPNGRIRIALLDGSILNVGSDSQLQILRHDAQSQQTQLELQYGRVRAKVVKITKPGGSFELRTPVATAGVVGTGFIVRSAGEATEIFCLEDVVRVRNRDESISGEVILHPGEFTRVLKGMPPLPAAPASPEQLRKALEETDLPPGPLEWSRVEISWPPEGCSEAAHLILRAWAKQMQGNQAVESPVDPQLISGTLRLGAQTVYAEAGRATMPAGSSNRPSGGTFTPSGSATPIVAKVWEPLPIDPGQGWRAPRAVFTGSAFYVLGPMGAGDPEFQFEGQSAELLWQSPCGAGFLSPRLPGREYGVTLSQLGTPVASGRMNLIEVAYRVPNPPAVLRGQGTSFGADYRGLAGLDRYTEGRPIMRVVFTNMTPAIIGDLGSTTPGSHAAGETITYVVTASNVDGSGTARLDATARGRSRGAYDVAIESTLDDALGRPRAPLAVISSNH